MRKHLDLKKCVAKKPKMEASSLHIKSSAAANAAAELIFLTVLYSGSQWFVVLLGSGALPVEYLLLRYNHHP